MIPLGYSGAPALQECRVAASLSNLDNVIDLFGQAFYRRPTPHPLRVDSLRNLADALLTRFSLTNRSEDLDNAASLYVNMVIEWQSQVDVRI